MSQMPMSMDPQMMQGGSPNEPVTADQMFEQRFGQSAFDTLRSKFPQLVNYVVTFQVLDSDVDKGTGLGAFVMQSGKQIRYIPVVMANGNVVSCELLYDKDQDMFSPLTSKSAQEILNQNMLSSASLMQGQANVEDTRSLFRNIVRPPASSSVVLAGMSDMVPELPDAAKKVVTDWLNKNPETLAKIAEYYDVQDLGKKLACIHTAEPRAVNFYDLKEITKEAAASLSVAEKRTLLRDGFLVKQAAKEDLEVVPSADVDTTLIAELGLEECDCRCPRHCIYPEQFDDFPGTAITAARAIGLENGKLRAYPVVMTDSQLWMAGGGSQRCSGKVLVQGSTTQVTEEHLSDVGAVPVSKVQSKINGRDGSTYFRIILFVPKRTGYYALVKSYMPAAFARDLKVENTNGTVRLNNTSAPESIVFTSKLDSGAVKMGDTLLAPKTSMIILQDEKAASGRKASLFTSFDDIRNWVIGRGRMFLTVDDGISTGITDTATKKTANFHSKTAAAKWLAENYNLSHDQVNTVLNNRSTTLLNKYAFGEPQVAQGAGQNIPVGMPMPAQPGVMQPVQAGGAPMQAQPNMMGQPGVDPNMAAGMPGQPPVFDPAAIQAAAGTGDPNLVDTGILSSFAQDPDIKELLLDYLPHFTDTLDKLGRCIMLLCLKQEDLEDFYGRDKYAQLLGSCRKLMKLLGETVESLRQFTNMA